MRGQGVARFYVHTVTVETFLGTNGYGQDTFAAPVTLAPPNDCFVDGTSKLVINKDGVEVISGSTVYTAVTNGLLFPAESRVTINGVVSKVIRLNSNDAPGLGLPEHVAVNLL